MADPVVVRLASPPAWYPNTVEVGDNPAIAQVAGSRPGRVTIAIENLSTADSVRLLSVADPNGGYVSLLPGGSISIDTSGEVYAMSEGGDLQLQVMETAWPAGTGGGPDGPMPNFATAIK